MEGGSRHWRPSLPTVLTYKCRAMGMLSRGDPFVLQPYRMFCLLPRCRELALHLFSSHFSPFVIIFLWCRMLYQCLCHIFLGSSVTGLLFQSRFPCILLASIYSYLLNDPAWDMFVVLLCNWFSVSWVLFTIFMLLCPCSQLVHAQSVLWPLFILTFV